MSKRRRRWGLIGLMSVGGLMVVGALGSAAGSSSGSGSGGGSGSGTGGGSGDGPGGDGPGGDDPGGGTGTGGTDNPYGDLPPPPPPIPDEPEDDPDPEPDPDPWKPGQHLGGGNGGGGTTPTPKPTKPGTTDGPKPPIDTPEDEPVLPEPEPELDPPWSELLDPSPRGGAFYPVVEDDRFGGMSSAHSLAYRYLLSEAYLAASEVGGLDHEDASAWALAIAKQDKLRLRVIDLIQCSGWNDAMYGADPVTVTHASKHGRSILLRPVHGPTAELLENGLTPFRNITMAGNPADDDYRYYELLWMPAIDLDVLWESGGQALTTTGMEWDDGTSMENPPPWVMARGIEDLSGALVGDFGCPGSDGELEVE